MKASGYLEKFLYTIASLGILGGVFFLFKWTPDKNQKKFSYQSIGAVTPMGDDVRWRGSQQPLWAQVRNQTKVFSRDKIFTGPNSRATVELKNNSSFIVAPDSLVEIVYEEEIPTLNLDEGGFSGTVKEKKPVLIRAQGRKVSLISEDAEVKVEKNQTEMRIEVIKGEVVVGEESIDGSIEQKKVETTHTITQDAPLVLEKVAEPVTPAQFLRPIYEIEWLHSQFAFVPRVDGFSRESGVTPDLLDTVKGSRLSCTRSDFAFQEQSAGQHDYNLQTIPVEV